MLFSYEVYNKIYPHENVPFRISSYFPLIIKHGTFTAVDAENTLDDRFSVHCSHYIIAEDGISKAKSQIKENLHPLTRIMINYCIVLYYSKENGCNIDQELKELNNIKRDVYFSDDYLFSIIVIIDSDVPKEDEGLINFLLNIQNANENFEIYAFTYDREIEANFEILINSITASVIYRSHSATKTDYLNKQGTAFSKIDTFTQSLVPGAIDGVPKLRWRSMCASFNNKQHDIIAYILKEICNLKIVEKLSADTVVKEASNIGVPFSDSAELRNLLKAAFNYIPAVNKFIIPENYTFRQICDGKFGAEGYTVAEISCKTTLADHKKNFTVNYEEGINQLLAKLAEYYHEDLIGEAVEGINKYIALLKRELEQSKNDYDDFSKESFFEEEKTFEKVLEDYVGRFIQYEELRTRLNYWEVIKIEIKNDYALAAAEELKKTVDEFRRIKSQLAFCGTDSKTDGILPGDFARISIKDFLQIPNGGDYINMFKECCEKYINKTPEKVINSDLGYVLSYEPASGISEKFDIIADYDAYQLAGNLLFSEYWSFL